MRPTTKQLRFQELIHLTKKYVTELHSQQKTVPCSTESLLYFTPIKAAPKIEPKPPITTTTPYTQKKGELKPFVPPSPAPAQIPTKIPTQTPAPTPTAIKPQPEKKKEQALPLPQPPPSPPAAPTHTSTSHTFPFLPKKFIPSELPSFGEIEQKLRTNAPQLILHKTPLEDDVAVAKSSTWKSYYPRMAILSFLEKNSKEAEFIQTVSDAVSSKITPCALYHLPEKRFAAELITLAQCEQIQTFLIVFDLKTAALANEFCLHIPVLPASEEDIHPLTMRGTLFTSKVLDFAVTTELPTNQAEKAALWKHLRRFGT